MNSASVGGAAKVGGGAGKSSVRVIRTPWRMVMLAVFLVATLPVMPYLMVNVPALRVLMPVHLVVHALPLMITAYIDAWFLDGGEVTPKLIPLWSALTGVMLWPLAALALWPALWESRGWRRGIVIYSVAAVLATIGAAWWVFTHLGIFF